MKRLLATISLLLILIGICVYEETLLKESTDSINSATIRLDNNLSQIIKPNNETIWKDYKEIEKLWDKYKNKITYFVNYDKIKEMDESITKLEISIRNNDKSLSIENTAIIHSITKELNNFMGFSLNNLL